MIIIINNNIKYIRLFIFFIGKFTAYSSLRTLYSLSRYYEISWNINAQEMGFILGLGELISVPAGFFGSISDVYGERFIACISQLFLGFSVLAFAIPNLPFIALNIFRCCLGFNLSIVSMALQSSIVKITDKNEIGKVTGILELGWSGSVLIIVPIMSVLYYNSGPESVWLVLGIFCLLPIFPMYFLIPKHMNNVNDNVEKISIMQHIKAYLKILFWFPSPFLFSISQIFANLGMNAILTSFPYWAVDNYNLNPEELGSLGVVLGIAELTGALFATFFADKIGLKLCIIFTTIFFGIISFFHSTLTPINFELSIVTLFAMFVFGEASFVTRIAYAEQLVDENNLGTYIGIVLQMQFIGRALGAILADPLYKSLLGHSAVGLTSFICCIISSFLVIFSSKLKQDIILENVINPVII